MVLIIGAINLMSVKGIRRVGVLVLVLQGRHHHHDRGRHRHHHLGIGQRRQPTGIHNLWSNGGFFSNGFIGMILSLQLVIRLRRH